MQYWDGNGSSGTLASKRITVLCHGTARGRSAGVLSGLVGVWFASWEGSARHQMSRFNSASCVQDVIGIASSSSAQLAWALRWCSLLINEVPSTAADLVRWSWQPGLLQPPCCRLAHKQEAGVSTLGPLFLSLPNCLKCDPLPILGDCSGGGVAQQPAGNNSCAVGAGIPHPASPSADMQAAREEPHVDTRRHTHITK
jgi:hypothetical protein